MIRSMRPSRRDLVAGSAAFAAAAHLPSRLLAQAATGHPGPLPAQSEFVIRGATVITMDPGIPDLATGDIHVRDGAIVAVGAHVEAPGIEVIDGTGKIAMPGLVDTHWHMWGSVARNMAGEDNNHGYFVFARAVGRVFKPEDNARGVRLSLAEAIHGGITTVHNWSHNIISPDYADAEIEAHRAFGVRALFGYGYAGVAMQNAPVDLADLPRVKAAYFAGGDGLLTLGMCSRGPESNSLEITQREWKAARDLGLRISAHVGTNAFRVKQTPAIRILSEAGLLGPDILVVHDTVASDEDIGMLARSGTFVSMSPLTEMRTGFGIPPVLRMLNAGVPIALSIDTTVLSGNADLFTIMKALQNVGDGSAPSEFALPPRKVLEMATIGGARALGIADRTGSLTPGKRADIALLRAGDINMGPSNDPVRMIVQSAQPANVEATIVDGRFLKRDGKLVGIDTRKLLADASETMDRVRQGIDKLLNDAESKVVR